MPTKHNSPAGGTAGQGGNCAPGVGAYGCFYCTPPRPACQALFARWLAQARACAARDLEAADRAKASGDIDTFCYLRKRGLHHQIMQIALEAVLGG